MTHRHAFPVVLQFFLSHVFLVVLFVIGSLIISAGYSTVLHSTVSSTAYNELMKSADILTERLSELQNSAYIVAQNKDVAAFSDVSSPSVEHFARLHSMDSQLESIYSFNDYISDFILWFNNSDSAWMSIQKRQAGTGYLDSRLVKTTANTISFQGDSLIDFEHKLAAMHELSILQRQSVRLFSTEPQDVFLYSVHLAPLSASRVDASLTFILNPKPIQDLLVFDSYDGVVRILDSAGNVIFDSVPNDTAFADLNMSAITGNGRSTTSSHIIFTYLPDGSHYTYQLAVPLSYMSDRVWLTQRTSIIIAVLIALSTLGLSIYFSHTHAKPVHQIVSLAKPVSANKNEYDAICDSIHQMLQNGESLTNQLETQKLSIIYTIFSKILAYEFHSEEAVLDALANVDVFPDGNTYAAVYIHLYIPADIDEDSAQVVFREVMFSAVQGSLCLYPLLHRRYTLFCQFNKSYSKEVLTDQLQYAIQLLQTKAKFHTICIIGPEVQSLLNLPDSLREARKMHHFSHDIQEDQVLSAPSSCISHATQCMSETYRHQIVNLCLTGKQDALDTLLQEYFTTSRTGTPLSKIELLQLGFDLRSIVLQTVEQLPAIVASRLLLSDVNQLPSAASLDQLEEEATSILHQICSVVLAHKQSASRQLCAQVYEYISSNYANTNLSLSSIAEHMNLNEKYLSQIYKKECNQNLTADIEAIRMRHVLDLMENKPKMTLADICTACGYGSLNSFYKAFKRIYGVSPSDYRKQLITVQEQCASPLGTN